MEAYRFETKVLKNGVIKLPQLEKFIDKDVELYIVLKSKKRGKEEISAESFLKKWTGFIPDSDPDVQKFDYLMDKYK